MTLPDPMSPPDCDLRDYVWMPLLGNRLFQSKFYAHATDAEFRTAMHLWWSSWQECPAGSLPNDDRQLAILAGFGRDLKGWVKVKKMAMHGFIECADGRMYHPLIAEEAVKAFQLKLKHDTKREKDRQRLQEWRENKAAKRAAKSFKDDSGNDSGNLNETLDETRFKTGVETQNVALRPDQTRPISSLRSDTPIVPKTEMDFDDFWERYPRKVGKDDARKAFAKARKRASQAEIIAAIDRQRWNPDPTFIPYPASWLNGGSWQDDPDAAAPKPTPRAPQNRQESATTRLLRELHEDRTRQVATSEITEIGGFQWPHH